MSYYIILKAQQRCFFLKKNSFFKIFFKIFFDFFFFDYHPRFKWILRHAYHIDEILIQLNKVKI